MNNEDTNINEPSAEGADGDAREGAPTDRRPLGYWLRAVDGLLTREFAAAFDGAGVTRRDWMLLNALSGDVELPAFAERFARKGKRLRGLEERGWVEESGDGTWVLTDEGRAAKERLGAIVDGIRSRVAGAVSPEDFATTLASLEAIARELGWDENARMPRARLRPRFRPGIRLRLRSRLRDSVPARASVRDGARALRRRARPRPARCRGARLARRGLRPPTRTRATRTTGTARTTRTAVTTAPDTASTAVTPRRALRPVGSARVRARLRRRLHSRALRRRGGSCHRHGLTPTQPGGARSERVVPLSSSGSRDGSPALRPAEWVGCRNLLSSRSRTARPHLRARPRSPRSWRPLPQRCPRSPCGSATSTCSSPTWRHPSTRSRPISPSSSSRCCCRPATTCASTSASSPRVTRMSRSRLRSAPIRGSSRCSRRRLPRSAPIGDDAVVLAVAGSSDDRANEDCRATGAMLADLLGREVRSGFLAAAEPRLGAAVAAARAGGRGASWSPTICWPRATSTISRCASPTAARSPARSSTTTRPAHVALVDLVRDRYLEARVNSVTPRYAPFRRVTHRDAAASIAS